MNRPFQKVYLHRNLGLRCFKHADLFLTCPASTTLYCHSRPQFSKRTGSAYSWTIDFPNNITCTSTFHCNKLLHSIYICHPFRNTIHGANLNLCFTIVVALSHVLQISSRSTTSILITSKHLSSNHRRTLFLWCFLADPGHHNLDNVIYNSSFQSTKLGTKRPLYWFNCTCKTYWKIFYQSFIYLSPSNLL